jgi:3-hydroxyisobutyrate dehydrogenase
MRIGVAGLGRMGSAIAERLNEVGHDLVVWNRSPEKTKKLAEAGAETPESPAALAGRAEAVVTILTDAAAIEAVYRGSSGLLSGDIAGKLFIDMSTVRPETEAELAADVRAAGAAFVECPVGGTTGPARAGKLIGLAGGTPEDVERARPILESLCRRLEHAGPVGAGASLKLAINLPLLVFYQALGEAYTLCRHLGRDPAWLMDLFADTSGGPNILKVRGPAIAKALAGEDPGPAAFSVDSIRKDLRTMTAEAKARGATLPLVERTLAVFDEAAKEGWGGRDGATLPAFWPGRAGPGEPSSGRSE